MQALTAVELRRGVLAVSVLRDLDVDPAPLGVVLPGDPSVWVSWGECRRALAGRNPESQDGHTRLSAWLHARRWAADAGPELLRAALRPVGLPVEHVLHPGLDWVRRRVLGDVLDLGLGAVGLEPGEPDRVVLVPQPALELAGVDADVAWLHAARYLEDMGRLAALRTARDARGQLRPMGDCDVVTLLGSTALRRSLAAAGGGLGTAVVPMRRRGWTQLSLIDPAFGPAAAAATDPADRGFPRPLLLTVEELTIVPEGGRPEALALREPVTASWPRDPLSR